MFVFDSSAYINGWRDHLPPSTFPSVWALIDSCFEDGRVVSPREVYNELTRKDDDVAAWAKDRLHGFVEPTQEVMRAAGAIFEHELPASGERDAADPWVIAEARVRRLAVVTYEGRTFSGVPTSERRWATSMPGICLRLGVGCVTLPEALGQLGGEF
ncbi:MAG TPA: DUF4411 family protein [Candidatus Binatia bacterium]|nr:DUF4411 family protein [Candidatus Binatia bacterium]